MNKSVELKLLQAQSRERHNPKVDIEPKVIVVEKPVEVVKVVEKVKIVEKPVIPNRQVLAFIQKAIKVCGIIQNILNRIEEEKAMAKMKKVLEVKKVTEKATHKPPKKKQAKKLVFNPKAHTGMVDWDKIRHF